MKKSWILIGGLLLVLVIAGCVNSQTNAPAANDKAMVKSGDAMADKAPNATAPTTNVPTTAAPAPSGDNMAAKGNIQYAPFTQAAFEQAKAEGKTIFLEFYANWCPICQAQAPALEAAIPQIASDKLVAFRVNYKDSETDADEAALAQQLNITYQHTHIILQDNKIVWRSNESLSEQDIKGKLEAYA